MKTANWPWVSRLFQGAVGAYLVLSFNTSSAQDIFYYHTIRTNAFGASFGRTYKLQYTYQMSRRGQLKVAANYVFDAYEQNRNRVEANIYNVNLQLQQNFFHYENFFAHANFGVGGYQLEAADKLGIKHRERRFTFTAGVQLEFYILRNRFAVLGDYEILWMPFSDIYTILHVPTLGLGFFF